MKARSFKFIILVVVCIFVFYNFKTFGKILMPIQYSTQIEKYAKLNGLSSYYIAALVKTESNYNPEATSNKGATGLMQITATTGQWAAGKMKISGFTVEKLKEPEYNLNIGCWYIKNLITQFDGDVDLATAAYNGGIGNVKKWLADSNYSSDGKSLTNIPFKETEQYVKRVTIYYKIYKFLYDNW